MIHLGFETQRCTLHGQIVPLQAVRERLTAAFHHRIRMPTGCSQSLGDEGTGLIWFKDTKNPGLSCHFSRLAHFNTFCRRRDGLSQWGSSAPTEVDGAAALCTLHATSGHVSFFLLRNTHFQSILFILDVGNYLSSLVSAPMYFSSPIRSIASHHHFTVLAVHTSAGAVQRSRPAVAQDIRLLCRAGRGSSHSLDRAEVECQGRHARGGHPVWRHFVPVDDPGQPW